MSKGKLGWKPPEHASALPSEWQSLCVCTKEELRAMGMGNWDGRLMLFPKEWYPFIPENFEITSSINGKSEKFRRGVTDDDIRFGCLAYGVNAIDGAAEADS